jgi:hypothetical protein
MYQCGLYLRSGFDDLFTGVMPTIRADVMRAVLFAAVGAVDQVLGLNGVMRSPAIASSLGYLSLW